MENQTSNQQEYQRPKEQPFNLKYWLQNSMGVKLFAIGFLILLLLIPQSMIKDLIYERENTMNQAIAEVSGKWGGSQTITSPVLHIPYEVTIVDSEEKDGTLKTHIERNIVHILPNTLNVDCKINPQKLNRGIYDVVLYTAKCTGKGEFVLPDLTAYPNLLWAEAFVSIGLSDMRGVNNQFEVFFDNKAVSLNPGIADYDLFGVGAKGNVLVNKDRATAIPFSYNLNLNGSSELFFTPVGKKTNITMSSNWSDPSFKGAYLPSKRTIENNKFTAQWSISHLNRTYPQFWGNSAYDIGQSNFGLSLLLPVDQYQQTLRAAKYAIMFVALTFLVFFFVEILYKARIHPLQYLLVGFALFMFYVLLLSISEHIGFNKAYFVSTIATVGLITTFTAGIVKKGVVTGLMCGLLITIYGFLYGLLILQDYALLLGSLGLFLILSVVMYLSRKINWYGN